MFVYSIMAAASFAAAIFFDNAQRHIDEVQASCPRITCVKIPESYSHSPSIDIDDPLMVDYITRNHLQHNSYLAFSNRLVGRTHGYDPVSGIHQPHIDHFNAWEAHTHAMGPNRALILDWDRTITVMEGVILPPQAATFAGNGILNALIPLYPHHIMQEPQLREVTTVDALMYLCGGGGRLNAIVQWLNAVAHQGIHIMILTNNKACVTAPHLFNELVVTLLQGYPNYSITCSGNMIFQGDKGLALSYDPRFNTLCGAAVAGGRRKNNTRRRYNIRKTRRLKKLT